MEKLSPDNSYISTPRPGVDYLLSEILILLFFIVWPQIQCRTGCFIWTPWRIILFGVIYLGLLWHMVDSFLVKYTLQDEKLIINGPWIRHTLSLEHIKEVRFIKGFSLRIMFGWSFRNALNRYHNLVLIETREGQNVVISPENPQDFIVIIRNGLKDLYGK